MVQHGVFAVVLFEGNGEGLTFPSYPLLVEVPIHLYVHLIAPYVLNTDQAYLRDTPGASRPATQFVLRHFESFLFGQLFVSM